MEISERERKRLIQKISKASGIAQYALIQKMNDEQVVEAAKHLDILKLVKDASNYNRYCQGQKTKKVNDELKETKSRLAKFLDIEDSEIINAGKWLMSALSKKDSDRKQALLEKDLVHKEDYNQTVTDMSMTIQTILDTSDQSTDDAVAIISQLEHKIDVLKGQLEQIKNYIAFNDGVDKWKTIRDTFHIDLGA